MTGRAASRFVASRPGRPSAAEPEGWVAAPIRAGRASAPPFRSRDPGGACDRVRKFGVAGDVMQSRAQTSCWPAKGATRVVRRGRWITPEGVRST